MTRRILTCLALTLISGAICRETGVSHINSAMISIGIGVLVGIADHRTKP